MSGELGTIERIARNIKSANINAIKILYKLLYTDEFPDDHPRSYRRRIRQFSGFQFTKGDDAYKEELHYVLNEFSLADLVCVTSILTVDHHENKEETAKRILDKLMNFNDEDENDEDEQDEDESEAEEEHNDEDDEPIKDERLLRGDKQKLGNNQVKSRKTGHDETQPHGRNPGANFALTFRDIEESIRKFGGDDSYRVECWFEELEETAELMNWCDLQKLIFGKKSLTGLAQLFIRGERRLTSYSKFKAAMLAEFGKKINSAQLHRSLALRKLRNGETVKKYFLLMRELAAQGAIDDDSFMQYVIDGIPDDLGNKTVLYGARTLREFRDKLDVYQTMISRQRKVVKESEKPIRTPRPPIKEGFRCYNCGGKGHKSANCSRKSEGAKCFICNEFGHIASYCPKKNKQDSGNNETKKSISRGNCFQAVISNKEDEHQMMKLLKVNGVTMTALVDTGSDLNLLRLNEYLSLGAPNFERKIMRLGGFGNSRVETLGFFNADMEVDDVKFQTDIYVVPDDAMNTPLVIGKPILKTITITVNSRSLTVARVDDGVKSSDSTGVQETNLFLRSEINQIVIEDKEIVVGMPAKEEEVRSLIENYEPKATRSSNIKLKLVLTDDEPVCQPPRRLPIPERMEVERQIKHWLEDRIIRESSSEYASPIVLVKKKNGETRICIDYRRLNRKIIRDRYPLPIIEDQLDKLSNSKVFTTLDLKNGFFHVPLEEESVKYTAFVTPAGQYEFLRVPFGLCNSPAIFQRFINDIFKDYIRDDVVLTYMDDLVIPGENEEEAIQRLRVILRRAEEFGLNINWKKCQFLCRRIEYLGHQVQDGKISPVPNKVAAVMRFPTPTNCKQLQSFLGLTGYFRKFIRNYAAMARPLSELLKKDRQFKFGVEEETSFNLLKQRLAGEPVLKIFEFGKETELHTDASKEGYGAVLLQRHDVDGNLHPVYYMSRKTNDAEKKYHSYELEVLAVIEAVKKFRVYLLGVKFKLVTDCAAFQMTLNKKDLTTRVARWALLLEEFDYEIEHRAGERMRHCDALSRCPIAMMITNTFLEKLKTAQVKDEYVRTIMEILKTRRFEDYVMRHGLLYREKDGIDLLVIPAGMQNDVIKRCHETGHFGVRKVRDIIEKEYWIPKLTEKIQEIISNCIPCIISERKAGKQEGLLNPIPKGDRPLETFHLDHLGPLSSTAKNYKYVLIIVDAFSKFTWIYPTKTTNTDEVLKRLEEMKSVFGNPKAIITDKGSAFTSERCEQYCKEQGILLAHITTGVPRGNGQAERINRCIIPILTKLSATKPEHWYKHVRSLQEALNSTLNRSIGASPFEVMFGVPMRRPEQLKLKEIIEEEFLFQFTEHREDLRNKAKQQIKKIQEENCRTYNKKRVPAHNYAIGDVVAIKRTQYAACAKLMPKYLGPYQVTRQTGKDRYEVRKIGNVIGPRKTETSADQMKPWNPSFETNDIQDGRTVGSLLGMVGK